MKKEEIIIGTQKELVDYFKDELKILSYRVRFGHNEKGEFDPELYTKLCKEGANVEMAEKVTIESQLNALGVDKEGFGMIVWSKMSPEKISKDSLQIPEVEIWITHTLVWKKSKTDKEIVKEIHENKNIAGSDK